MNVVIVHSCDTEAAVPCLRYVVVRNVNGIDIPYHNVTQARYRSLSVAAIAIATFHRAAAVCILLAYAELEKPRTRIFICRVECLESTRKLGQRAFVDDV